MYAISRTDYADLYDLIGTTYGDGDGSTTFNVPDYSNIKHPTTNTVDVMGTGKGLGVTNSGDGSTLAGYWCGADAGSGHGYSIQLSQNDTLGSGNASHKNGVAGVITDPTKLLHAAQAYLRDNAGLDVNLEVSAVDLSLVYPNYDSIAVGERVRIISKPHEVDEYFICTKIELDMLDPSNTIYNFGTMNKKLLSEKVSKTNNTLQQQINNVNTEVHNNYSTGQSTYVHQDELNDAINRLTNSDIDSICAS